MRFTYFSFMSLLLAVLFIACQPKSVELQESFNIPGAYRPGNVFASINSALMDEALNDGKEKTYQIGGAGNVPAYDDLEFYPVMSAKDLHSILDNPLKKGGYDAYISNIDFNTHFAVIIAHPDSYETHYFDKLMAKGSGKGLLKLELNSRGLGAGKSGIEALMQKWKIKVYSIEKKNYDSLTLKLNKDEEKGFSL